MARHRTPSWHLVIAPHDGSSSWQLIMAPRHGASSWRLVISTQGEIFEPANRKISPCVEMTKVKESNIFEEEKINSDN